jgi:hypothetical protein
MMTKVGIKVSCGARLEKRILHLISTNVLQTRYELQYLIPSNDRICPLFLFVGPCLGVRLEKRILHLLSTKVLQTRYELQYIPYSVE